MQRIFIKLNLPSGREKTITIYLYTDGHVVIPRDISGVYGSAMKTVKIAKDQSFFGNFLVRKNRVKAVDRSGLRCSNHDEQEPIGQCIIRNLENIHNCTTYHVMADMSREFCSNSQRGPFNEDKEKYERMSEVDMVNKTGCLPSCERFEMSLEDTPDIKTFYGGKNRTATLSFQFEDGSYNVAEEYIVYDTSNFIADVGGYLGLLMGHSILSIYYLSTGWLTKMKIGRYLGLSQDSVLST